MSAEWSKGWPAWRDDGKRVRLLLDDGKEALGTLRADDSFFDGEDEVPVFSVHTDDGQELSFAGAKNWRFEAIQS